MSISLRRGTWVNVRVGGGGGIEYVVPSTSRITLSLLAEQSQSFG